ncbi:hypothetical protein DENSPDRAFT_831605 [Dentipellis sp. KUC8613]|nr:hypothetical protein DENSPDRAFT_831605 [Dentipellis sp. KUC8613]
MRQPPRNVECVKSGRVLAAQKPGHERSAPREALGRHSMQWQSEGASRERTQVLTR